MGARSPQSRMVSNWGNDTPELTRANRLKSTHDSSLSSCIVSIIASEAGYAAKTYDYFMQMARLDLDDTLGNKHYGVHSAAMAGTWIGVAYGFAGMRVSDGAWRCAPTLPAKWRHYRF